MSQKIVEIQGAQLISSYNFIRLLLKLYPMKSLLLSTTLLLLSVITVAQMEPKPVLENEDIDRFINTHKQMSREFEQLDEQFEEEEDENMPYTELLQSYEEAFNVDEAVEIIEKYGWDKETCISWQQNQ